MIKLNGEIIKPTIFPDKTSQVWKLPNYLISVDNIIHWNFESEAEIVHLAQLKSLIDKTLSNKTTLQINYLPYARQDKDVTNDTTFALHSFAKLLNALEFTDIHINDPHSDKALDLINNSYKFYPVHNLVEALEDTKSELVVYPDKGALKKYSEFYNLPYVYGEKDRNQLTGVIERYELKGNVKNQNVMIVDDICDGGMTFILLAKELYNAGANSVNLFVTHGIFSKGIKVLKEANIKRIFTKDGEVNER